MEVNKWLNDNKLSIDIWNNKYRWNNETLDEWFERVSSGDPIIKRLIKDKKFLFGGRTLSNINTNKAGSFSNCYSIGYVEDSLDDIMKTATDIAKTFKAQGGQGLSLSKIRPKGSLIKGQFKSDGIVPFMEIFNTITESISQGGSRKGALLMSIDIWHPEAETFITIKSDLNKINKANLSLEIDNEFMTYVKSGVTSVNKTFCYEGGQIEYTVNPVALFDKICQQAWDYAEPGIIYTDKFRNYNIVQLDPEYVIETCNPCGEQPLSKHSACNLCSINLSEYVIDPFTSKAKFDYASLSSDIPYIVKAMDDVLEKNLVNHALPEQRKQASDWRNIGIGIMGLADVLIKLGLVYGSPEAVGFSNNLMKQLFRSSVFASVALAKVRGSYPKYKPCVWDSDIMRKAFTDDELNDFREINKLRNCSLLSIAPTGSIGTMFNVSTGCEPYFSLSYTRRTESLNGEESYYQVDSKIVEDYKKITGKDKLTNCFVTAQEIHYISRIEMQSVLQEFCDTAISSTINLPEFATVDDVRDLYIYGWEKGLKGLTIFRDNCKRLGILTIDKPEKKEESVQLETTHNELDAILPKSRDTFGKVLSGATYKYKTACGTLYITINKDENGNIIEIFTNSSKNGTCKANLNGETRLASLALRSGIKVDEVIDSLKSIQCQSCIFAKARGNKIDGSSCPDIISKCIKDEYKKKNIIKNKTLVKNNVENIVINHNVCPECGKQLQHIGGCVQCECGYSKCE